MTAIKPSDGPIAVTGASGYVGSHVVGALLQHGYEVRACVTDPSNEAKTSHLMALSNNAPGSLSIHRGNLLEEGSYDDALAGAVALVHVGTAMAYGGKNTPQEVYDGAVEGTKLVVRSVERAGTVRRIVYTSSYAAVGNPAPAGYEFTEADWCSDNRENDQTWNLDDLNDKGENGYAMAKEATERWLYAEAETAQWDAISINPLVVLGPLLSTAHDLAFSWQWALGRMLAGKECNRGFQHLWNIVDVRDVGEAHALALGSDKVVTGDRFILAATDESAEIDVLELQQQLQTIFPEYDVGGPAHGYHDIIARHGQVFDAPRAKCTKARNVLGLETHALEDTLRTTGETIVGLGIVEPKQR